ncbi:HAD family hydrolase [Staphylococcus sp. 11261D007BR]
MTKSILFDVDGVFLDESRCFDVSALTVYELLFSESYLNLESDISFNTLTDEDIQSIRRKVFQRDIILNYLKSLGINSNWDMLFVVFAVHLTAILHELPEDERESFLTDSQFNHQTLKRLGEKVGNYSIEFTKPFELLLLATNGKDAIYEELKNYVSIYLQTDSVALFDMHSALWQLCQEIYQEWYLGTELYEKVENKSAKTTFKKGYIYQEKVLADVTAIQRLLKTLSEKGYTLGLATGRPRTETIVPFKSLGLLEYFEEDHIATASDVLVAEQQYPDLKPLGKPNPFTYIVSFLGNQSDHYKDYATNQNNRFSNEAITIVGDSLADLFSAQTLDVDFIGTLTGLKGEKAAEELKEHGATTLVSNVLDIEQYLI